MTEKDQNQPLLERSHPFHIKCINGGLAGMMAICLVQPMDLLKTHMQLQGGKGERPSFTGALSKVIKTSGIRGLYNGLSAAVFRQATYGTTRLATFNTLLDTYKEHYGAPPMVLKLGMGMVGGGVGAFVGTPAEVCLIRMTADKTLPPAKRRNYRNVFNALARIAQEEGILALWTGTATTVTRAMVVNCCELGVYAQAREMLIPNFGRGYAAYFFASFIAGIVTVAVSQPIDVVKTRVQNAPKAEQVTQIGTLKKIIKKEGITALWNGWLPTYGKIGPHAIFTFLFLETLNDLYSKRTTPPKL